MSRYVHRNHEETADIADISGCSPSLRYFVYYLHVEPSPQNIYKGTPPVDQHRNGKKKAEFNIVWLGINHACIRTEAAGQLPINVPFSLSILNSPLIHGLPITCIHWQ